MLIRHSLPPSPQSNCNFEWYLKKKYFQHWDDSDVKKQKSTNEWVCPEKPQRMMTAVATSVISTIPHALHARWATYSLPAGCWRSLQALHLRWEPWNPEVSQIWISQSLEVVSLTVTVTASDGPQSRPAPLMLLNSNPTGYFPSTVHRVGFSVLAWEVSAHWTSIS